MKRALLILAVLLALLLCACGKEQTEPAEPAPTGAAPTEPPLPEARRIDPLSDEESRAMAMVLNANRVLPGEGELFCYDFDEDWSPVLARYRWEDGRLEDFTVLAKGVVPEYLCRDGDWLYYIDRGGALERVPAEGGDRQILREGPCRWLCLRDGLLYFCDGEGRFLSRDPENGRETILLEGPCAFAYPLEGGWLWQDGSGSIRFTDKENGAVRELRHGPASAPLLLGDRLWVRSGASLCSVNLEGGDAKVYPLPDTEGPVELLPQEDGLFLRGIQEPYGPIQWMGGPEGPFDQRDRGYLICDWLGDELRVDTVYEPDGRIRWYLLQDSRGIEICFLAGRTLSTNRDEILTEEEDVEEDTEEEAGEGTAPAAEEPGPAPETPEESTPPAQPEEPSPTPEGPTPPPEEKPAPAGDPEEPAPQP